MAEIKTKVDTFKVDYGCESCSEGIMLPTGLKVPSIVPGDPIKMQHRCTICKEIINLEDIYPFVSYDIPEA